MPFFQIAGGGGEQGKLGPVNHYYLFPNFKTSWHTPLGGKCSANTWPQVLGRDGYQHLRLKGPTIKEQEGGWKTLVGEALVRGAVWSQETRKRQPWQEGSFYRWGLCKLPQQVTWRQLGLWLHLATDAVPLCPQLSLPPPICLSLLTLWKMAGEGKKERATL